jgi:protein tyrosine phosphatase (PTP) superfamily phosphohydrolase (DUF442 family)
MLRKASCNFVLIVSGTLILLVSGIASAQTDSPHSGPVMNYHEVNDRLVTGGHLLDRGAATLKDLGVKVVINLLDEPPIDEEKYFSEQGIEWINIPVEWLNPKKSDFEHFSKVMREHQGDHVLVQCFANYRASAMTYLYRVVVEEVPEDEARKDLDIVWDPSENATWSAYINDIKME